MRRNSIIADAKFATLQNLENTKCNSSKSGGQNRHEILIKSTLTGKHGFSVASILKYLEECNVTIQFVEIKRPEENSSDSDDDIRLNEVYVQCQCSYTDLENAEISLEKNSSLVVKRLSQLGPERETLHDVPWFPRKAADLDYCRHLREVCEDNQINTEHPGYSDQEYRERRRQIVDIARKYKHGDVIPRVPYTSDENQTWKTVYSKLRSLHAQGACSQFNTSIRHLEKIGLYSEDNIPQLEDVSRYLQDCSGFRLRPVGGLVSARDFLASLAVKVFQCTQYVRHHLSPMHTPEPDCCHELIGHVPMLCDPDFARFSQELGIVSLGATDKDIEKLATLYWFTVEFGLCLQQGQLKVYGAGILSAYGELEHALSKNPEHCEFDAEKASTQSYQDEDYQPLYFIAKSFQDVLTKVRKFTNDNIIKCFDARYNADTESVEVFRKNNPHDVARVVEELNGHITFLRGLVG
ncbi:tyrosine 3-monooxygenase-like [Styela clava]|uniref:tyrosine 3-monooxygenase-like n=1 Tax=Styela clava TaxID=7725 RepID=UPI00193962B3|nr:tyrosine 3-monooxygenase-like [Styela clava]